MTAIQERAARPPHRRPPRSPAAGVRRAPRSSLGALRRARPADHRHVPAGAARRITARARDDVGGRAADPHRHPRRPGAGPAGARPAVRRARPAAAAARRHGPARPGLAARAGRPEPRRPRRAPGAPGRRDGGRRGDRPRRSSATSTTAGPRPPCSPGCSSSSGRRRCWRPPSAASSCASPRGAGSSRSWPSTASLMLAVGCAALPETLPPERRQSSGRRRARCAATAAASRDRAYVGLVLVAGLTMAGPVQLRVRLGVRLPGRVRPRRAAVRPAVRRRRLLADRRHPAQPAAAPPLVAAAAAGRRDGRRRRSPAPRWSCSPPPSTGGLPAVVVSLWVVLFACGLALPNAPALALSRHGEAAGTAAALLGAVQFGVGALVSPVVGLLGNDAVAIGIVVVVRADAGDRRPGRRRPALAADRAPTTWTPARPCTEPPVRLPATGWLVEIGRDQATMGVT